MGHVEWVDFVSLEEFPRQGEISHAEAAFSRAAGGGSVVAVVLTQLGAEVDFFTALGHDPHGEAAAEELTGRGITLHVAWREQPTRRAVTLLMPRGERTIITIGDRLAPIGTDELRWERLNDAKGVYFTAGDARALQHARRAQVLVASPRARETLQGDGPLLDAIVFSAHDDDESDWASRGEHRTRLMVATEGASGGRWWGPTSTTGRWDAVAPPGEPKDAYGCGDSFAAGFTYGLAKGMSTDEATKLGARCGAKALTQTGPP